MTMPTTPSDAAVTAVCVGGRGGCGTSLLAGALALAWADAGRRPLLIDLDLGRGDLAPAWSVPAERSLADLVPVLDELTPAHLRGAAFPHPSGVSLIAAPVAPRPTRWSASAGGRLVREAARGWGAVVADLGCGGHRAAAGAVVAARHVILVCPPTLAGARRAQRVRRTLADLGAGDAMRLVIGPVSPGSELSARAFSRASGCAVAAVLPRSDAEAHDLGGGRWSPGRRRRLTTAVAELAEALA